MKIDSQTVAEFKEAFKNDSGLDLSYQEAKEAVENLVNFFDLSWRFDQEDKQKIKEMEVEKDGNRIQNA